MTDACPMSVRTRGTGGKSPEKFMSNTLSKPGNALLEAKKCPFDIENASLSKARKLICRVKTEVDITFMFQ